jgi:arylesterase/paraoxonase
MLKISILLVLIAILFPFANHLIHIGGLFQKVTNLNNHDCVKLDHPLLNGCEDVHLLDGKIILSCAVDLENRKKYWPPSNEFPNKVDIHAQGALVILDLNTKEPIALKLSNFDSFFQPHGLGVVKSENSSKIIIMVVNHRPDASVIEVFEHELNTFEANHVETVKNNLIHSPNDVLPISRNSFYATNDCKFKKGIWMRIERWLAQPWSNVIYRDTKGNFETVAKKIIYANGITSDTSLQSIFVVSSLGSYVQVYERRASTGSLRLTETVKMPTGFMADNAFYDQTDGSVIVTGHASLISWLLHARDYSKPSPTKVVRLVRLKGQEQFYGHKFKVETIFVDDGSKVSGGSIGIIHKKRLVIGNVYGKGLSICNLF